MEEIWKPVVGEVDYAVSNLGRVKRVTKSTNTRPGKILKPGHAGVGKYPYVVLRKKNHYVHVLVLEAFVSPRPEGCNANHKDGVKQNNKLGNLEWVTYKENSQHAVRTGLLVGHIKEKNPWYGVKGKDHPCHGHYAKGKDASWYGKAGKDHPRHKDYKKDQQ